MARPKKTVSPIATLPVVDYTVGYSALVKDIAEKIEAQVETKAERVIGTSPTMFAPYGIDPVYAMVTKAKPELKVRLTRKNAKLPTRGTVSSAGLDIYSTEKATIHAGRYMPITTGLELEIPAGHFGMLVPRSGLAAKSQVSVVNSPGIIDSDFRGELMVLVENRGQDLFVINVGDRIAQLVIMPYAEIEPVLVDSLSSTDRGAGGFGSTGK